MLTVYILMSKQQKEFIPEKGTVLYVDIGNSALKAGLRDRREWTFPFRSSLDDLSGFIDWVNRYTDRIDLAVITSVVAEKTETVVSGLAVDCLVLATGDIPAKLLDYETPGTLGMDRFLGCYAAVARTRNAAVVIDAGSACTVDYMSKDSVYRGGVIMPGIDILEKTLVENIPGLPAVERAIPDEWPGKSTRRSLQWGLTGSFVMAIETMIDKYENRFGAFDLVATGGQAGLVAGLLDRSVKVYPGLVFDGMKQFREDFI